MSHHPRARSFLAVTTGVALVASVATAAVADPSPTPAGTTASATPGAPTTGAIDSTHSVTLITGDVVTVTRLADGTQTATVASAPNASGGVLTHTVDDQLLVVPDEARSLLAAGVLDQDLFNMTLLIEQGYADEDRASIPVIVEFEKSRQPSATLEGARTTANLESINARAMEADKELADDFWQSVTDGSQTALAGGIAQIHLDAMVQVSLTESIPIVGADQAWADGLDGTGVTVAVLDTGADTDHPDLVDTIVSTQSFVPDEDVEDLHGHGTHVASTVAGSGAASAAQDGPQLIGVAPGADLAIGKVLDADGNGMASWIIEGMEWAADNADVVNMSLGSFEPSDGTDPMAAALQAISDETGTLFVVAGGNYGRVSGIGSPGAAEAALTVAATDKGDMRTNFSDQGPRLGDGLVKPDIAAPGQDILAARAQASQGEGWYSYMTGTSMAAPHVAGAAAILKQQYPEWTGGQVKAALMSSAAPVASTWDGPFQAGTGRVDVPAALAAPVISDGNVSFGYFAYPHDDDMPVTEEITYTNLTDADLELVLRIQAPEFTELPEGLVELAADTLVVPANGTASVEVTLDPRVTEAPSSPAGYVIASLDSEDIARTSWGMFKEEERYNLTLTATDLDGSPAAATVTFTAPGDFFVSFVQFEGETTLRLPANTYTFMSFMDVSPGLGETGVALLGDPVLRLEQDTALALDAREASEISVEVPDDSVAEEFRKMEYDVLAEVDVDGVPTALSLHNAYLLPPTIDRLYAGQLQESADEFEYRTRWRLRTPFVSVQLDGTALDVVGFGGSAIPEGEQVLPAVYAGTGSESDLAEIDVTGAAAVIHRDQTQEPDVVVARVVEAGAELIIMVNDEPGKFIVSAGYPGVDIPVVGMSGVAGADFVPQVQAGGVELVLGGGKNSPVVFDLVDVHAGTIPADLAFTPDWDELARVDSTYQGDREREGGEFRYDFGRFTRFGLGYHQVMDLPTERTEWVSAQQDTEWYQDLIVLEGNWNERGSRTAYQPGEHTSESWYSAVVQPRIGTGYWGPNRQGNFLQVNLPSWSGDEPTHTGGMGVADGTDQQVIRWYEGDTLLKETTGWQSANLSLPDGELTELRVTNEVARDAVAWPTSIHSLTEWTFWTGAHPELWQTEMPFVQVDFDVATDFSGVALSGRNDTIGFTAWPLAHAYLTGEEIVDGSLEISYDEGATWQILDLAGTPGGWTAEVTYPADAEHVTLRGSATDDRGNAVTMQVTRAYLLPEQSATQVTRIAGADRYETAAEVAQQFGQTDVVFVATGEAFPDALAAAAFGGAQDVPVLLTKSGSVPDATVAELERLQPQEILVLGGEGAIGADVIETLAEHGTVTRVAGSNRYATAAAVSDRFDTGVEVAFVASGTDFPDALAGGARAGSLDGPVLLSRPDSLPATTVAALERLQPERIVVLGGTGALSPGVAEALAELAPVVDRVSGSNRFGTAAALSAELPGGQPVVYLATGLDYPDALAGSALAGSVDAPVLLARATSLPAATALELVRLQPQEVVLLGGTGTLGTEIEEALAELFETP